MQTNKKTGNFIKNFDFILFIIVIMATIFGIMMVSSATNNFDNSSTYIFKQVLSFVIGIILMFIVTIIDYNYIGSFWRIIYIVSVTFLVSVLFLGTGVEEWGATRVIQVWKFTIQPSEIVKIGFIITLAKHIDNVKENINDIRHILMILLHLMVPVILIHKQPDLGTQLALIFIFIGIIFIAGINLKYIIISIITAISLSPIAWFFLLSPYQKNRILTFLNPESDPLITGYQVIQSKISVGSGQLLGKGLFKGTQTQLGYLPAKHTDFIFAVIGEELGFLGCVFTIILLMIIIWRCISIARNSKDTFGSFICTGVASMFIFHTLENIGMCIGLTPVTGIPLPFISYGNSALITNLVAIGLVLNVNMRRKVINF